MLGSSQFVVTWTECDPINCDLLGQRFILQGPTDCAGDCNRDAIVTVDELVTSSNLALNTDSLELRGCLPADPNLDYVVTVDEIVMAVDRALCGCSNEAPAQRNGEAGNLTN